MASALSARGLLTTAELVLGTLFLALGGWAAYGMVTGPVGDAKDQAVGWSLVVYGVGFGLPLLAAAVSSWRVPARFAEGQAWLLFIPALYFVLLLL